MIGAGFAAWNKPGGRGLQMDEQLHRTLVGDVEPLRRRAGVVRLLRSTTWHLYSIAVSNGTLRSSTEGTERGEPEETWVGEHLVDQQHRKALGAVALRRVRAECSVDA